MSVSLDEHRSAPADPLVVIGPTASGKSSLAVALGQRFENCEVVSSDAMAVYRGMDIGTAKPTADEQGGLPHHLLDVADATEDYTVAIFRDQVSEVLAGIESRGNQAIVVGGTGLYVQAVVDDFALPPQFPSIRERLEGDPDTQAHYDLLQKLDPAGATKMLQSNRRRIIRALEVTLGSGKPFSSFGPGVDHYGKTRFRLAGLEIDRAEMDRRIDARYEQQMADGFLEEVRRLLRTGLSRTASQALGYRELAAHLNGEVDLDEALELARKRTKKFARRQQLWFRRDPRITWFPALAPDLTEQVFAWWTIGPGDRQTGWAPPSKESSAE